MSALVLTVLICAVWLGFIALGYLRGGWREVVTLAAILLAYAVASEWAGPNGRDLAGLFGDNTFRSSTTIGLAYLFVGTLLFGYFGGSRLPRPIPLSTTERFIGGAIGFCNGGVLLAMTLRILHAYAFASGDGRVLTDATLSRWLITDVGYLLIFALLVAVVAPFVSFLLVRQPHYTAQYTEEPALQPAPVLPWYPDPAQAPPAQPVFVPPGEAHAPVPTDVYPTAITIPANDHEMLPPAHPVVAPMRATNGAALIPLAPTLPPVASVPILPAPGLPAVAAQGTGRDTRSTPAVRAVGAAAPPIAVAAPVASVQTDVPGGTQPPAPVRSAGPPGTNITTAHPLPTAAHDAPPTIEEASRSMAETAPPLGAPPSPISAPPPDLPPSTVGPAPFTARTDAAAPSSASAASGGEDSSKQARAQGDAATRSPQASAPPTPTGRGAPPALRSASMPAADATGELMPATPILPRKAELPAPPADATPETTPEGNGDATSLATARVPRARVATARVTTPSAPTATDAAGAAPGDPASTTPHPEEHQPPVPLGPNMHPCPACDYSVRNGARFCPNCGAAQPRG